MNFIKISAVVCCATVMSTNTFANWTAIGKNPEVTHYIDQSTVRKTESKTIKVWSMQDFSVPPQKGVRSTKAFQEFDCADALVKINHFAVYSENMGSGNVILNDSTSTGWKHIIPNTMDNTVLKFLCRN